MTIDCGRQQKEANHFGPETVPSRRKSAERKCRARFGRGTCIIKI